MIFFAAALSVVILCASCASDSTKLIRKGLYDCSGRLETAKERMGKKGFSHAIRILDEIKYQCGGSALMDSVYYYTAISQLGIKQYVEARDEFENLYREFPRSPFTEEARYRVAHIRYIQSRPFNRDQTETRDAMRLLGDYLDIYPNGAFTDSAKHFFKAGIDKLAEKEFYNARFYRRQKEHEAALIYYRSLLSDYPESKFAPEAVVGMAEMLLALGRTEDAQEVVEELDPAAFEEKLKLRIEAVKQQLSGVNTGSSS
jgi:outer membrane protein assembly factor BamD